MELKKMYLGSLPGMNWREEPRDEYSRRTWWTKTLNLHPQPKLNLKVSPQTACHSTSGSWASGQRWWSGSSPGCESQCNRGHRGTAGQSPTRRDTPGHWRWWHWGNTTPWRNLKGKRNRSLVRFISSGLCVSIKGWRLTPPMLPAFWGGQVHAIGRNSSKAPTGTMLQRCKGKFKNTESSYWYRLFKRNSPIRGTRRWQVRGSSWLFTSSPAPLLRWRFGRTRQVLYRGG